MIGYVWSIGCIAFRAAMVTRFLSRDEWLPIAFGISESLALFTTVVALVRGKVDSSWSGLLLPVLHLAVLLFDPSEPRGPDWACGFYLLLCPAQMALRLRMGWCCTVGVPCFVTLLDRWPYSVIRHPLAAVEIVLASLVTIWLWSPWNFFVGVLAVSCAVTCVLIEERFLTEQQPYQSYCDRVQWRLCPGVW